MAAKQAVPVPCSGPDCTRTVERTPKKIAASKTGKFYCSYECMGADPTLKRKKPNAVCQWCGGEFYPSANPKAANRFCCAEHRNLAVAAGQRVRKERSNKGERKDGTVLVPCTNCDNPVWVIPSKQHQTEHYCSMECFHGLGQQINGRKSSFLHRNKNKRGQPYQPKPSYREVQTWDGVKGAHLTNEGYVKVRWMDHPSATKDGTVMEHRAVMEHLLGRRLEKHEQVHHVNSIRDDNRPENLLLVVQSQPAGAAIEDLYDFCLKFVRENEATVTALKRVGAPTRMSQSHYAATDEDDSDADEPDTAA